MTPLMYSRRLTIALETGRMKTTLKITKLMNWISSVPAEGCRNMRGRPNPVLLREGRHERRHFRYDDQDVERKRDGDERDGFQNAHAQKHEGENVRAGFGLARDGLHGLGRDASVADCRAEGHARDDDAEGQKRHADDKRLRIQGFSFLSGPARSPAKDRRLRAG